MRNKTNINNNSDSGVTNKQILYATFAFKPFQIEAENCMLRQTET